jgi:hypothetical protein
LLNWSDARRVAVLAVVTAAALLIPTLLGRGFDLAVGSAPWGFLAGSLVGVATATGLLIRIITLRYEILAPPSTKEEQP